MSDPKFKQLLSFPGGGVRGICSAVYLRELCKPDPVSGKPLINLNNLFSTSGTSTGSIVAAALCKKNPYQPDEIIDLFEDLAGYIFKRSSWKPEWLERIISFSPFEIKKLEEVLKSNLGEGMLVGDCQRRFVCVTYRLNGKFQGQPASTPIVIHSHGSKFPGENFMDVPLYKAVTSSCAAPSYFKPYEWDHNGEKFICVDGGITSNISVLANYAVCRDRFCGDGKVSRKEIASFVIGNGSRYAHETIHSLSGWRTPKMLKILVTSLVQSNAIYELKLARKFNEHRLFMLDYQPDRDIDLSDYKSINYLKSFAESKAQNMSKARAWLRGYFV